MGMYFFPTPYEDELLYSVLARYSIQSGNRSDIQSFDDIFGSRNVTASVELQGRLDELIYNLPINSTFTAEYFILQHTLFPYLTSFLSKVKAREVIGLIKDGDLAKTYNKVGIPSSNISQNLYLRFCPECVNEDIKNFGETYWHRIHQVIGVFICPTHKVPTYNSNVYTKGKNRQSYIPATINNLIIGKEIYYSKAVFEKLLLFAKDAEIVLNKEYTFQDIRRHKQIYMGKLIEMDIANLNTMVHQKRLRKLIIDYWGEEVLNIFQNNVSINKNCSWLGKLVIDSHQMTNPTRNLLLIRALDIDVKELLDNNLDMDNTLSHQNIWINRVVELSKEVMSLREMAKILDTTPKTIRKYVDKFDIEPFWTYNGGGRYFNNSYRATEEFETRRQEARNKWLELRRNYPNLSRYKLKIKDESLFTWLYRYEKEWLWGNSISIGDEHKKSMWHDRDIEYLPKIKAAVAKMYEGKPKKISWGSVGGSLGINGWLSAGKSKLPMIMSYMQTAIETRQEYQIRCIGWAIDRMEEENNPFTKWNLIKMSGVNNKYIESISKEIAEVLKERGYDEDIIL